MPLSPRCTTAYTLVTILCISGCVSLPQSPKDTGFQRKYSDFDYCAIEAVRQVSQAGCGPACLAAVTQYWNAPVSPTPPDPDKGGYSLAELRSVALEKGVKAYILAMDAEPRLSLEQQIEKGRPVICAIRRPSRIGPIRRVPVIGRSARAAVSRIGPKTNHFVVVVGFSEKRVLVMDPATGFESLAWSAFERSWAQQQYAALLISG